MRRLLFAAVALSLLSIAIPWSLSGEANAYEWAEYAAGAVALLLLPWRPRWACFIGAVVWLSALTDFGIQEVLGNRETLSRDPWLIAGVAVWAASSSLFLLHAGEELADERGD